MHPVAQRRHVALGLDPDPLRLAQLRGRELRQLRNELVAGHARPPGKRRLGWTDDHAILIDPHAARNVHDAEQLVEYVRLVDQRGMGAPGAIDPRRGRLAAAGVKRDGDDLESLGL